MNRLLVPALLLLILSATVFAQPRSAAETKTPTITEKVAAMQKFPGYFPFY